LQLVGTAAGGEEAVAEGGGAAGAPARDHEPRQGAGEIGRRREALAHVGARRRVGHEKFDRVLAPGDRGGIGQRGRQALGEQARAPRRYAAVDGGKEGSPGLARERAAQRGGATGRPVGRERRALRLAHRGRSAWRGGGGAGGGWSGDSAPKFWVGDKPK